MSEFNFTQLSSTVASPHTSFTNPAINERGDTAFEGFLSPDLPPLGIFSANSFQDNVGNKTIIDNSATFLSTGAFQPVFDPSINNRGMVSFIENETSLLTDENGAPILDGNRTIFRADPVSQPSPDNDRLYGDVGNNYLDGNAGDDLIVGGDDNDTLLGGEGSDILRGGAGYDNLTGGTSNDTLCGGDGADVFNLTSGHGTDRILDYVEGVDKFSLGNHLEFSNLNISQHNGDTEISLVSTGEVLASLYDVDSQAIDLADFV